MADKVRLILVYPGYVDYPGKIGEINWEDQLITEKRKNGSTYNIGKLSHIAKVKTVGINQPKYLAFVDINKLATIDLETGKTYDARLAFKLNQLTKKAFYLARTAVRRNYLELGGAVFFGFFLNYIIKYLALMTGRPVPF